MRRVCTTVLIVGQVVLLLGCITPPKHDTASGRPEVTISKRTAKAVLGSVTNEMANRGYAIRTRSEMNAVFEKPLEGSLKFMLSGPNLAAPVYRVTFDFVETDQETRILAMLNVVENPGATNRRPERVMTAHDPDENKKLQELLALLKTKLK